MSSLKSIYEEMMLAEQDGKHRDITSSTADILAKAHPKSPMTLDYFSEIFGLAPDDVKRLPLKSVEMLMQALTHLIDATKEEPVLRQALRKMIQKAFIVPETDEEGNPIEGAVTESKKPVDAEVVMGCYREFLNSLTLTEASKATKFNYKMLLDLDPTKLMNPFFVQLVTTFQMESLTRMQKQGMLLFLKKLAELAESNNMIAQALTKIVRTENIAVDKATLTKKPEEAPVK